MMEDYNKDEVTIEDCNSESSIENDCVEDVFDTTQQFVDNVASHIQENTKLRGKRNVSHMDSANPTYKIRSFIEVLPKLQLS